MFRGKESSNTIELSRLVPRLIEFWCFGLPATLRVGGWGWGCLGSAPTHVHMHVRTHTHGKHDNFMQMAAPTGGISGNSL